MRKSAAPIPELRILFLRFMHIGLTQQRDRAEFGGESPLTMRYGLRVDISHPLGPSTGTA